MRLRTVGFPGLLLATSVSLCGQAAQLVGSVIDASTSIRSVVGLTNATDIVGACRDNAGFYWTSCEASGQVLLIRLSPAGAVNGFIITGFGAAQTVVDLAYDGTNDHIWIHAPPNAPLVYHATTGALIGQAQGLASGNGIAWDGSTQVRASGSNLAWQTGTLNSITGGAILGPTLQGLLYTPASTTFWGSKAGGDPGLLSNHEFTELPSGATMPPHLEGIVYVGALGGLPRGCEAWQDPNTNEWLGVFCQEGDNSSAVLYTARLSEPTGPGCGGPVFLKGPAIAHDLIYADVNQIAGLTWLMIAWSPGTFNDPAMAPGCTLHLDVLSSILVGPLFPQGGGIVSVALPIVPDPSFQEMPLWFQFGSLNLQFQFVLSEARSAAIKYGGGTAITITETFATAAMLDQTISSGSWNNGATAGLLGGDGRHGSFDPALGTQVSPVEFIWDTTNFTIPASNSLSGQSYNVTDGRFYFTDMTLPAGYTVHFVGPVPPVFRVRGKVDIAGTIKLNGAAMSTFDGRGGQTTTMPYIIGQPGGLPGAGGGRGGRGGYECQGAGPIIVAGEVLTDGADGEDVQVTAGHAYAANAVGTGGRGSVMNPPSGAATPNSPLVGFVYRAYFAPGGSGGGFSLPGGTAGVTPLTNLQVGPTAPGGIPFSPIPLPNGVESLGHFTIGGSGGGGGATHAFGTIYVSGDVYVAGSGGSGGGGTGAIRAGNDCVLASGALVEAKGGAGAIINGRDPNGAVSNVNWGVSSPGGGGSGGSFLLQSGGDLTIAGDIDTSGGDASRTQNIATSSINVFSAAGVGSPGFYRCEAAGNLNFQSTGSVPAYIAPVHSGQLNDRDDVTGCASRWYSTNAFGTPPTWQRYELDVDTDGDGTIDVTYTDSGAAGTQPANLPTGPVRIQFQGATLSPATGLPVSGTIGPWRDFVGGGVGPGIGLDSPNGFRFMMTFNRALFPSCIVGELRVFART